MNWSKLPFQLKLYSLSAITGLHNVVDRNGTFMLYFITEYLILQWGWNCDLCESYMHNPLRHSNSCNFVFVVVLLPRTAPGTSQDCIQVADMSSPASRFEPWHIFPCCSGATWSGVLCHMWRCSCSKESMSPVPRDVLFSVFVLGKFLKLINYSDLSFMASSSSKCREGKDRNCVCFHVNLCIAGIHYKATEFWTVQKLLQVVVI